MSQDESPLSMFPRTVRKKMKLVKQLGDLLHLMYLIIRDEAGFPKAVKYESFSKLLESTKFVADVLIRSSTSQGSALGCAKKALEKAVTYKNTFQKIKERYSQLADLIERWWRTSISTSAGGDLCREFYGVQSLENTIRFFSCGVQELVLCLSKPLRLRIKGFRLIAVEAQYSAISSGLAKTLIFIGGSPHLESCFPQLSSLDMFMRFSVAQADADHIVNLQRKGCAYEVVSKHIWLYPSVLRMRRTPYKRFKALNNQLYAELLNMYSKLYMDEGKLSALLSGEAPFNIMAMAPSITLGTVLCFPAVFVGELREPLTTGSSGVPIKASSDILLRGYLSHFTLSEHTYIKPGCYLFFTMHPATALSTALVYDVLPINIADKIKPKTRYVQRFDRLFPKVREVFTRR